MRIGICDDEKKIRDMLERKIKGICPDACIEQYASGKQLLLEEEYPDILLLDICMPDQNGMETARGIRNKNEKTILIFITAVEDYVFQAFDVGALHYLVKPFSDEKLDCVMKKAIGEYSKNIKRKKEDEENAIIIKTGGTHKKVYLKDIVYAEVFNRKVLIHKKDEEIEYYGKMLDLEKMAGEDFFRCHRAYLVHFKYVEQYDAKIIYLEKGTALMAKQKYTAFVKEYLKYNQRKGKG